MIAAAVVQTLHCNTYPLLIAAERLLVSSSNTLINADRGIALNAPGFFGRPCQGKVDRQVFQMIKGPLVPAKPSQLERLRVKEGNTHSILR